MNIKENIPKRISRRTLAKCIKYRSNSLSTLSYIFNDRDLEGTYNFLKLENKKTIIRYLNYLIDILDLPTDINIENLCLRYFQTNSKKFKNLLISSLELSLEKLIYEQIRFNNAEILIKEKINKDLVYNELVSNQDLSYLPSKKLIKIFKKYYTDKRIISLLLNNHEDFQSHIVEGYKNYRNLNTQDKPFPKKPKDLKEIHDFLFQRINEAQQLKEKDKVLKVREDFLNLDGKKIKVDKKQLTVKVAKSKHDLIKFGSRKYFDNCVGTIAKYTNDIEQGKSFILGLFHDKKPMYCIQTSTYSFKEAKGVSNTPIPKHVYDELTNLLTITPTLPKDFIKTSHFLFNGYKYNPEDKLFFLMFKDGKIYQYENVKTSVYEEFANTKNKGKFLNQVIKKYPCERLK